MKFKFINNNEIELIFEIFNDDLFNDKYELF